MFDIYTKRIFFHARDINDLQKIFSEVNGVLKVETGLIDPIGELHPDLTEQLDGIRIEFNPKKMDLSQLMDLLFSVRDPYENPVGIFYEHGEDIPQIDLHLNFIANRGKQPVTTDSNLTVNDTDICSSRRKFQGFLGKIRQFSNH